MMGGKLEEGQHGMTNTDTDTEIDWTGCDLVERIPGKVAGRPIVRGTRIAADTIVQAFELGESIEDIREGFPSLSVDQIKQLIEFAQNRLQHPQA
jgi:uncharacterized protein (DUF433 family)